MFMLYVKSNHILDRTNLLGMYLQHFHNKSVYLIFSLSIYIYIFFSSQLIGFCCPGFWLTLILVFHIYTMKLGLRFEIKQSIWENVMKCLFFYWIVRLIYFLFVIKKHILQETWKPVKVVCTCLFLWNFIQI